MPPPIMIKSNLPSISNLLQTIRRSVPLYHPCRVLVPQVQERNYRLAGSSQEQRPVCDPLPSLNRLACVATLVYPSPDFSNVPAYDVLDSQSYLRPMRSHDILPDLATTLRCHTS